MLLLVAWTGSARAVCYMQIRSILFTTLIQTICPFLESHLLYHPNTRAGSFEISPEASPADTSEGAGIDGSLGVRRPRCTSERHRRRHNPPESDFLCSALANKFRNITSGRSSGSAWRIYMHCVHRHMKMHLQCICAYSTITGLRCRVL